MVVFTHTIGLAHSLNNRKGTCPSWLVYNQHITMFIACSFVNKSYSIMPLSFSLTLCVFARDIVLIKSFESSLLSFLCAPCTLLAHQVVHFK